jgi:hypothetical protein
MRGMIKGAFPGFLIKTDQERVQNLEALINEFKNKPFTVSEKIDGCVLPQTDIITDQGIIRIGKIVNDKLDVKILTYNEILKCNEFKEIEEYHKYPIKGKRLISIGCGFKGKGNRSKFINCTNNHEFYTNHGWLQASELKAGDTIYHLTNSISFEMEQFLLGCAIGDGYISYRTDTLKTIHFSHCEAQSDYFDYKKQLCGQLFSEQKPKMGGFEGSTWQRRGLIKSNLSILRLFETYCIRNDKRVITKELVDKLTPIALAFWYMDDGSISHRDEIKQRPKIVLNTQRYSYDEVKLLSDMLYNKYGIKSSIGEKPSYKGFVINLNTYGTEIFASLIAPYICKSMKYKLPLKYENMKCIYDNYSFIISEGIIETKVLSVNILKDGDSKLKGCGYVYDLTVKSNHNYFANQILVHNSSFTAYLNDGEFGVCSRNLELKESDADVYWKVAKSNNVEAKLREFYKLNNTNIAIQGEIIGFGIQGNKYRMNQPELYLFDLFDIDNFKYMTPANLTEFCHTYDFKQCPNLGIVDLPPTIDEILKLAEGNSKLNPQIQREGIVFKHGSGDIHPDFGRLSFKAINNKFLLKFDE